ncbi:ABC transporter ATP-binding protein [Symbiobacterium thermophilum]|uniref:Bacitracin ABC transporter ATP-binding protein n=1 Tax=Symbiobacterium thermophilum TaxID=2734 RepID=A0A953IBA1_SYMTR|nr:ABC transporter ATP-binding protein [Symbiobacterium thermophilum]MBY6276189.1 bacitracin ABC transporter ATP-binding protein [Symbiobacterium thermophilum]
MIVLEAKNLTKVYGGRGKVATRALNNLSLQVQKGEFLGIMGPSGSGKTTLLNLLATIDRPTSGTVAIEGTDVSQLRGEQLALFRRRRLGFVFQDYNLLDSLTLEENIALPLVLDRVPVRIIKERLRLLAGQLGITDILHKYPYEVSGGQQQRAAAARAIIHEPAVILADEPTGNLDSRSAKDLMETFVMMNEMAGVTIVMVTHDAFAASYCRRIQFIRDGQIYTEIRRGSSREAFFQQILDVLSLMGGGRDEPLANRG